MSTLRRTAEEYLLMRRTLGYKLLRQGPMLMDFVGYLERTDEVTVTIEAAVAWATQPAGAAPVWWKRRLTVVRGFARHLKTLDPDCQIPPTGLLPAPSDRVTPYLFTPEEIAALIHAAGTLRRPLLAATYQTLISLLATTGLRVGEAIALSRGHVDFDAALIAVINSKFGKSRLVPLHEDTVDMLRRYTARSDELCPAPVTDSFFVSTTGRPLLHSSVDGIFAQLLGLAGIRTPPGRSRPRVHDLRHTMAVTTLLEWYRSSVDVPAHLPLLSTWLGHVDPVSTFWYLHASPELLALAARMLEDSQERPS